MLDGQGADEILAGLPFLLHGVYFWELIKGTIQKLGAELKASKASAFTAMVYRERDRQKRGAVAGMAADKNFGKQQQDWINYPYQSTKTYGG